METIFYAVVVVVLLAVAFRFWRACRNANTTVDTYDDHDDNDDYPSTGGGSSYTAARYSNPTSSVPVQGRSENENYYNPPPYGVAFAGASEPSFPYDTSTAPVFTAPRNDVTFPDIHIPSPQQASDNLADTAQRASDVFSAGGSGWSGGGSGDYGSSSGGSGSSSSGFDSGNSSSYDSGSSSSSSYDSGSSSSSSYDSGSSNY